jgi:tetratricopeptide (TPR) repeat protein
MAKPKMRAQLIKSISEVGLLRIGVLSLLGIAGAWFAFALAISGVTRSKSPSVALTFMPGESAALAARADQIFFASPDKPPKAARQLALSALRQQALNAKALRLLGYYADADGDRAKADALVRQAASLSRREAGAQLWLIEANAREGDTEKTLVHYDIVLRTKPDTQTLLFPRLLAAIEDQDIRTALKPYIRADRGWATGFFFYASGASKNLPALVDLVLESGGLPDKENAHSHEVDLLSRLVVGQYFADARRLYLQMDAAKASRLTSAAFDPSDRNGRFGPMGWQMLEDPDAGGGFSGAADEQRIAMAVFANSATTRRVATKLLYLPSGNYSFSTTLASIDRGDGGFLSWQLRCPAGETGRLLWTINSINATTRGAFAVPADCPVQALDLIVSGGKGQTGLEATVSGVSIRPLQGQTKG